MNYKLESVGFLGEFELKPCSQTNSTFSKHSGNNRKRKRKPKTFQNFKNHGKILIIKKVTSILVSTGAIFTCSSVNPTFNDYIPYCYSKECSQFTDKHVKIVSIDTKMLVTFLIINIFS